MSVDTKDKILAASVKLFSDKGYAAVRTREIAESAGVNEVTLFRCFGNKKSIYHETFRKYIVRPTPEYLLQDTTDDIEKDFILICNAMVNLFKKNSRLIQMSFKEIIAFEEIEKELKNQPEQMIEIVKNYIESHSNQLKDDTDAAKSSRHFVNIISGATFHYMHHAELKDPYTLDECMLRFVKDFTRGILKCPAGC